MPPVSGSLELPWEAPTGIGEDWFPHPKVEQAQQYDPPYGPYDYPLCSPWTQQWNGTTNVKGMRNAWHQGPVGSSDTCVTVFGGPPDGTMQPCVADPNEFEYIADGYPTCPWMGSDWTPWDGTAEAIVGPNLNCPTAMLGLSSDPAQLYAKLDHMYPVPGGTLLDVGLMWGLRALSDRSDWATFWGLPSGREAAAFTDTNTRKVMILLTDGYNQMPYHYEGYYGCGEAGSIADRAWAGICDQDPNIPMMTAGDFDPALARQSLDALTLDACRAIREDYNVELYVIAVDVTDTAALSLLQSCAADTSRFFDVSSSDLDGVFEDLAASTLRLSR